MTESDYIAAVRRNDQRIFLIAFSYLQRRCDAEDVMQNTFLKLWKSARIFESEEHVDRWLTTVCVNECRDLFKLTFRKHIPLDEAGEIAVKDERFDPDLFNAISSLKKKERLAVHLFYYEELPVSEISAIMKTKEGTVKSLLHRARQHLKEKLGDEWINE